LTSIESPSGEPSEPFEGSGNYFRKRLRHKTAKIELKSGVAAIFDWEKIRPCAQWFSKKNLNAFSKLTFQFHSLATGKFCFVYRRALCAARTSM